MAIAEKRKNEGVLDTLSLKWIVNKFPKGIIVIVAILSLLLVAGVTNSFSASNNRVTLKVNGIVRPVEGWMFTVSDVLEQADVSVGTHDIVTPDIDSPVKDGQTITVQSAHKVYVVDDQERRPMWVAADSIFDAVQAIKVSDRELSLIVERSGLYQMPIALQQIKVILKHGDQQHQEVVVAGTSLKNLFERNGIEVGPLDEVIAKSVSPGQLSITVDQITREIVTEETEIDFETKTNDSPELYKGDEKVITKGEKGLKVTKYVVRMRNNKEIEKSELSSLVTKEPVDEVVEVGTKDPPANYSGNHNSGSGMSNIPSAPANPSEVQQYARSILPDYGMADSEFGCLVELFNRESGWRWNASNGSSGAYGIPQAYPGSKMASAGADWRTNPQTQVRWGLGYIKGRYGTPCKALSFQRSRGWY